MVTVLLVPSSLVEPMKLDQLVVVTLRFCCSTKPVEGEGQVMMTLLVEVSRIFSNGPPGVCTAVTFQNPPVTENWALVMGAPASGWPMVPLNEYWLFVLVPPPPSMVYQSME